MEPKAFETERLILRNWRDEDLIPFREMNGDPEVMRYFVKPMDPRESDDFAARIRILLENRGYGLWAVEEKGEGRFIGFTGLYDSHFEADFTPCTEIGWRLKKEYWRRGYATEAARAVLDRAFRLWGYEDIVSFTSSGNLPSIAVMQKIGLKQRDFFLHPLIDEGDPLRPHVLFGLSREEWKSAGSSFPDSSADLE